MRRTRRRKRWTWFPVIGTSDPNVDGTDDTNGRTFGIPFDGSGATNAIAFPLVPDVQTDPDSAVDQTAQVALALSTDYEIERIVGKCWVSASAPADDVGAIAPKIVQVGVGLFIAAQADAQAGGGVNLPLGAPTLIELLENYNPISNDTAREPWMWKRDWILSTGRPNSLTLASSPTNFMPVVTTVNLTGTIFTQMNPFPTSNIQYGSVMDGPHVDCKSNRRVRSHQRLWCIAATRSLDTILGNDQPSQNVLGDVKGIIAIRVLGATRKPTRSASFKN